MGITDTVYFTYCKEYFEKSSSILELGAQSFLVNGKKLGYFKNILHFPIETIDITGENNSMKLNLAENIDFEKEYDLVTNFGTSEHVSNQYQCWKNIHRFCKKGGYVIVEIPEKGSWKNHCKYYVEKSFFNNLNKDFEIIFDTKIFYRGQGNNLFYILQKKSEEFQTSKESFLKYITVDSNFIDNQSV